MKLYTFNHFMLSQIAIGIQSGHAIAELFSKYNPGKPVDNLELDDEIAMLYDWVDNYKTHIALNGGASPDLEEVRLFFMSSANYCPWSFFCEDESLGNLLTSVAIVLPEKIYKTAELLRQKRISFDEVPGIFSPEDWDLEASKHCSLYIFEQYEIDMILFINNYRLA